MAARSFHLRLCGSTPAVKQHVSYQGQRGGIELGYRRVHPSAPFLRDDAENRKNTFIPDDVLECGRVVWLCKCKGL